MRAIPICICGLLLVLNSCLSAQSDLFQKVNYTVSHGLPSQTVYNAIQDHQGFLWICTDAGVSRFDGSKFTNYNTKDGLGENEILELFNDSRGRIWFLPFYGKISYWQQNKFYTSDNDTLLIGLDAQTGIRHMMEDKSKTLILFSESNCHEILTIDSNFAIRKLSVPSSFDRQDCLVNLWLNADGEACFLSVKGNLLVLKEHKLQPVPMPDSSIPKQGIVKSTDSKSVFVLPMGGLCKLTSGGFQRILDDQMIPEPDLVQRVSIDPLGNIWISHSKHNTLLFLKTNDSYSKPYPILKNVQANVCFDQSNNVWLCSSVGGLIKIPLNCLNETNLLFNKAILNENILSSYCQKDGTIWLGYSNGQVSRYRDGEIRHINLNRGTRLYNRVLDIGADASERIYFILDEGGCRLTQGKTGTFQIEFYEDSTRNTRSGKGLFYHQGNRVLFGFSHDYGGFPDQTSSLEVSLHNAFRERRFSHFLTKEGRLYMSTVQGLICLDQNKIQRLSEKNDILNCRINKFAQGQNGDILLATHGKGLIILRNDELFQHFDVDKGLTGFICRNIYIHQDTIWLATNSGITVMRYDGREYKIVRNINTSDGLISDDVNSLFIFNSQLYASTSKGLSVLNLHAPSAKRSSHPKVILQSLSINGMDTFPKGPLEFPYDDYHFKINFITPNLSQDYQLVYRYKLLPNDQDWTLTKSNSLEFAKLSAGRYSLYIQSMMKNEDWSEPVELSFHILPPFYRTWWFYSILATLLALITFISTHYILNRRYIRALNQVKTSEAIQQERNRIAADLHDDIGADLTNLVILSRLFSKGQEKENPLASKIELVAHELISKMNEVIWALNPLNDKLDDLLAYVHYYAKTVTDQHDMALDFKTELPMNSTIMLSAEQRRNTFLVIKEFLNNTLKHSQSKTFGIHMSWQKNGLHVNLSDTGMGSTEALSTDFGNGISNMRRRIETCGGTFEFTSNKPHGLKLSFTLPLKKTS